MKYQQPTFTLPASSNRVTQEEWDRIFNCKKHGKKHCLTCDKELHDLVWSAVAELITEPQGTS